MSDITSNFPASDAVDKVEINGTPQASVQRTKGQPAISRTVIPSTCPASYSRTAAEFWNSLFDDHQAGWKSLENAQFLAKFRPLTVANNLPQWGESAHGFCDFFVNAAENAALLLSLVLAALTDRDGAAPSVPLTAPARRVVRSACGVAVENWVNDSATGVPLAPPNLGDGIRLVVEDSWVAYLIAATRLKLKMNVASNLDDHPPAFIHSNAPREPAQAMAEPIDIVRAAVLNAAKSRAPVKPNRAIVNMVMPSLKAQIGADLLLGVRYDDPAHPLMNKAVRQQAFTEMNLPTVEYGDAGPISADLESFAQTLKFTIALLNEKLNPEPKPSGAPTPAESPENKMTSAGPTINVGGNLIVSAGSSLSGSVANANAPQAQAAVGDIHNQGLLTPTEN